MAVYGGSGAGKGYLMRIYHSRKLFQHDISIWVIDSDEQHEYAGRFCEYLHGIAPVIRAAGDVDHVPITRHSTVVVWDLSQYPDEEYGPAFARVCDRLVEYATTHLAPTDFLVDEAVNVLRSPDATERLNDLIQRGRHWGIGVNIVTQLVSDWLGRTLVGAYTGRRCVVVWSAEPCRGRCGRSRPAADGRGKDQNRGGHQWRRPASRSLSGARAAAQRPRDRSGIHSMSPRWLFTLALVLALDMPVSARAQIDPRQTAYVTAAPARNVLGFASSSGRDAIQPDAGCDWLVPGVNVIQVDPGADPAHLRIVDPIHGLLPGACTLVVRWHMSDVPCACNPSGACDVA